MALPAVLFGVPAAGGVPWLVGDNLIQNYPLRVLVGRDLRHGHLPLWNPYLWSGSPLLAGFSAGAAYPGTVLFAALPSVAAWAANQAALYAIGALGMLAFLRALGRSWVAGALGASSFAYGGFMAAQSVHLDIVQAAAWLPWAFLALERLAHRRAGRPALPWVALLGAVLGLMILTGAVEPVLDGTVALVLYTAWLVWRTPERRVAILAGVLGGVALGVLLGAAQLLPGAALQAESQRATHTFQYFTSGSMNKSLTILGLDPMLLGGDHVFPLSYYGTYNLPEVSSYVGILPVMAAFGLLARRHRRSPEAGSWWIWYVIGGVGLVLTWGSFTPLSHVLYDLPLFNRQRLLARNLLLVDLSLTVLLAIWVDRTFRRPVPDPDDPAPAPASATASATVKVTATASASVTGGDGAPARHRRLTSDVVLPLVPVAAVVALQLVLLAGGSWFPHVLHVPGPVTRATLLPLVAYLSIPTAIALAAGALVVLRGRLRALAPVLLATVVVADLVVFNVDVQLAPNPEAANSPTSAWANRFAASVVAAGTGPAGGLHRVAVFNPDRIYPVESDELGETDLTVLRSLSSIQGYGAIVNGRYETATDTHAQMTLDPASLADGTYTRLDLGVLATVPEYLLHIVVPPPGRNVVVNGGTPLPPVPPDPSAPPARGTPPPTPAGDYPSVPPPPAETAVAGGEEHTWFFGTVLGVRSVTVPGAVEAPGRGAGGAPGASLGLVSPDGRSVRWVTATARAGRGGTTVFDLGRMVVGAGVVLRLDGAGTWHAGAPVVATAGQGVYRLDGSLAAALTAPTWRFAGMVGVFPIFVAADPAGRAWVVGPNSASPGASPLAGASARVASASTSGDESIRVTTPTPAVLVRNVQFATGWQATVRPATGGAGSPPVRRLGLVQAVAVPAGTSVVSFAYRPHRVVEGFAASTVGLVGVLVCALWPAARSRRRRRGSAARVRAVGDPA